jgi:hypothetical protein
MTICFLPFSRQGLFLHSFSNEISSLQPLPDSIKVVRQILVLFVEVRILVGQQKQFREANGFERGAGKDCYAKRKSSNLKAPMARLDLGNTSRDAS